MLSCARIFAALAVLASVALTGFAEEATRSTETEEPRLSNRQAMLHFEEVRVRPDAVKGTSTPDEVLAAYQSADRDEKLIKVRDVYLLGMDEIPVFTQVVVFSHALDSPSDAKKSNRQEQRFELLAQATFKFSEDSVRCQLQYETIQSLDYDSPASQKTSAKQSRKSEIQTFARLKPGEPQVVCGVSEASNSYLILTITEKL